MLATERHNVKMPEQFIDVYMTLQRAIAVETKLKPQCKRITDTNIPYTPALCRTKNRRITKHKQMQMQNFVRFFLPKTGFARSEVL